MSELHHGGGMPIFVRVPPPDTEELLHLTATSPDEAEVVPSAWLLAEGDRDGAYKDGLLKNAEEAARRGDQRRAAYWSVGAFWTTRATWGPASGNTLVKSKDHEHFIEIAAWARALLRLNSDDLQLRDPSVWRLTIESDER
jgi:hypothetical protein